MRVFFYGLFMDEELLKAKGIQSAEVRVGFVNGHRLRIDSRATLVRHPDGRAYGAMMEIAISDAATCYNSPGDKVTAANKEYADSLLDVAIRLDFPDAYLE